MLEHIVGVATPTPFRITHFIPNSENCIHVFDDVENRRQLCMSVHPSATGGDAK